MSTPVVLSLFSGVGLLDMGFKAAGHCIVRGPDLLWGDDIRSFDARPLAGKIDGIIGGVPCQAFSTAVKKENRKKHLNLWPDFWRIVHEVGPAWVLAENVYGAEDAATDMFSLPKQYVISHKRVIFSNIGSAQARRRLIMTAWARERDCSSTFWNALKENGLRWGQEWRCKIGRAVVPYPTYGVITGNAYCQIGTRKSLQKLQAKYRTVTGDSLMNGRGDDEPSAYLTPDKLLDAFDLPTSWKLPAHGNFSRSTQARLITQGVPVAAAYALGMAIKAVKGAIHED